MASQRMLDEIEKTVKGQAGMPASPVVGQPTPTPTFTPSAQLTPSGAETLKGGFKKAAGIITYPAKKAWDITSKAMRGLMRYTLSPIAGGIKAVQAERQKQYGSWGDIGPGWSPAKTITPYKKFIPGAIEGWKKYQTFEDVLQQRHPEKPLSTGEAIASLTANIGLDPLTWGATPAKLLSLSGKALKAAKLPELATKILPKIASVAEKIPGYERAKLLARAIPSALSPKYEMGLEKYPEAYKAIRDFPYEVKYGTEKLGRAIQKGFKGIPEEHFEDMAKLMEPQLWPKEAPQIVQKFKDLGIWPKVQETLHGARMAGKESLYGLAEKGIVGGEKVKGWLKRPYLAHLDFPEKELQRTEAFPYQAIKARWSYLKPRKGAEGYSLQLPEVLHKRLSKQWFDETVVGLKGGLARAFGKPIEAGKELLQGHIAIEDKAFRGLQMPKEIVEAIQQSVMPKALKKPEFEAALDTAKYLDALWRRMATGGIIIPRSQFTGRNVITNIFHSWLVGLPLQRVVGRYKQAANELYRGMTTLNWTADMEKAQRIGVLGAGWAGTELTGKFTKFGKISKTLSGEYYGQANRFIEDVSRYALWKEMLSRGMDAGEAAEIVRKGLFNYPEITGFQKAVRTAIPFSTWKFKNVPLQLWAAFNIPGKWVTPYKVKTAIESMSGESKPEQIPLEAKREFSVRMPYKGKEGEPVYKLPGGGWEELASLTPRETALSLHPYLKAPLELLMNRELWSGKPIFKEEVPGALPEEERKAAAASYLKRQFLTYPLKPVRQLIPETKVGKFLGASESEKKSTLADTILRQLTGILTARVLPEDEKWYYIRMKQAVGDNKDLLYRLANQLSEGKITKEEYDKRSEEALDRMEEILQGNF